MTDSNPINELLLNANFDAAANLISPDTSDKFMTKLQELARQSDQDMLAKSDNANKLLTMLNPTVNIQSISPTPSTSSNSSCSSNIRHFKKTLLLQSNQEGGEGSNNHSNHSKEPEIETASLTLEPKTETSATHPHAAPSPSLSTHRTGSPFDVVNLLANKFKHTQQPLQQEDVKLKHEETEESDEEPGQLTIVSDQHSVTSNNSSVDTKPVQSSGKMDFSIRSLTSNNTIPNVSKFDQSDEDLHDGEESHALEGSSGIKTDNESIKSEDHEVKSEDELKPMIPEHFDFLRPSTSSFHSGAMSSLPSVSPGSSPSPSLSASPAPSPIPGFNGTNSSSPMQIPQMTPTHVGRKPLNGPPCSLKTLVDDGILDPMDAALTYEIMGSKFTGDLLENGFIRQTGTQHVFPNPSSWANACRSNVPGCSKGDQKNYGSAWSIIRYLGKRLDSYKLRWYRKQKKQFGNGNGGPSHSTPHSLASLTGNSLGDVGGGGGGKRQNLIGAYNQMMSSFQSNNLTNMANLAQFGLSKMPRNNVEVNTRHFGINRELLFKHDKISTGDPELANENINDENVLSFTAIDLPNRETTLKPDSQVGTVSFNSVFCLQPFMVKVHTNALLLIDFQAHLARVELRGYLGGKWEPQSQLLTIEQAYPLKQTTDQKELDKQTAAVKASMLEREQILVGWYHTHPEKGPQPTVNDIKQQLKFQKSMLSTGKKGTVLDYRPVVGLIVSPFNQRTTKLTSLMQVFWVMPLLVNNCFDFGRPMQLQYSVYRDAFLTQDLLVEMRVLASSIQSHDKFVKFRDEFRFDTTYWDKVYTSLRDKLPRDLIENHAQTVQNDIQQQALTHFWTFLKTLLLGADAAVPGQ